MSGKKTNYKIVIKSSRTEYKTFYVNDIGKVDELIGLSMDKITIMSSERSIQNVEKNQKRAISKAKCKFSILNQ